MSVTRDPDVTNQERSKSHVAVISRVLGCLIFPKLSRDSANNF